LTDGEFYEGESKDCKRFGRGIHYYLNGDTYFGEFVKGKRHGKGRFTHQDGSEYQGAFYEDKADGFGKFTDKIGNTFEGLVAGIDDPNNGIFVNGRLFGKGVIKFKNGDEYIGNFKDGRMSGHGIMKYFNIGKDSDNEYENLMMGETAVYDGQWKAGKRHGKGLMSWQDGTKFDGEWANDQRSIGRQTMIDGNVSLYPLLIRHILDNSKMICSMAKVKFSSKKGKSLKDFFTEAIV
jgi:hypothetical protein